MQQTQPTKPNYYALSVSKQDEGLEPVKLPDGFIYLYYDACDKMLVCLCTEFCAN